MSAAALKQLTLHTDIDEAHLTGNPQTTFFRGIPSTHTRFAMDSLRLDFQKNTLLRQNETVTIKVELKRYANLLTSTNLVLDLPAIWSDDDTQFRWIKSIGHYMILSAKLSMDGMAVQEITGDFMDIMSELNDDELKYNATRELIGNRTELTSPAVANPVYKVKDGVGYWTSYPDGTNTKPSIPESKIVVPLRWFFQDQTQNALPLHTLKYTEITVEFVFRPLKQLYRLFDRHTNQFVSPDEFQKRGYGDYPLTKFLEKSGGVQGVEVPLDIKAYIEANYVFLTREEANLSVENSVELEYLVDAPQTIKYDLQHYNNLKLQLHGPCKEIVFFMRRTDAEVFNSWDDYTVDDKHPLKGMQILFNDQARFDPKSWDFFGMIQPYLYHKRVPRKGIYVYSFSLMPNGEPSGSANLSQLSSFGMKLELDTNNVPDNTVDSVGNPLSFLTLTIYNIHWNIFSIIDGQGRMKYANI